MKASVVEIACSAVAHIERPRIYIAASLPLHGSSRYQAAITWAQHTFPHGEVFPSHSTFATSQEWLDRWPMLVEQIDLAVVVTEPQGIVGHGVYCELSDLSKRRAPVLWWVSRRDLRPALRAKVINRDDWRRYARLSPLKPRGKRTAFLLRMDS